MKINNVLYLFLVFLTSFLHGQYSIVFVHLGQRLPVYLRDALHQARLFNPEAHMYLVANNGVVLENDDKEVVGKDGIEVVYCEHLGQSKAHKIFLRQSTLDGRSKDGFWRKASERFFVLEELIVDYKLEHVFHLESDNMLYVNLKELLPIFKTYPSIAAVFDNDDRCIPSFVYVANPRSMEGLSNFFASQAQRGLNDMQIPALYKKQYGRSAIDHLPLTMKDYLNHYSLRNALGNTVKDSQAYCYKVEEFNSIFDGAAIGQFLGGTDPGNGPSAPGVGFINESCVFDPSRFQYEWIIDGAGRKVPYAVFKNQKYRINNLHIHSKNLKEFRS